MAQNLLLRPSGYYFRYIVPLPFRHLLAIRELRYTLKTPSRRVANKRARAVAGRVDSLFEQLARSRTVLNNQQIRGTIRLYVEEASERFSDSHLMSPPRDDDEHEAHTGILLDELPRLRASLGSSRFSDSTVAAVCRLFGLDAQSVDRRDIQFLRACQEWTRATCELYEDQG